MTSPLGFKAGVDNRIRTQRRRTCYTFHEISQLIAGFEDLGKQTETQCHTVDSGNHSWDRLRAQVNPDLIPREAAAAPSGEEISLELGQQLRNINIPPSCKHVAYSPEQSLLNRSSPTPSGGELISCNATYQGNTKLSLTPVNLKCLKDYVIPTEEGLYF